MRRILLKNSAEIWDFNPLRADAHADMSICRYFLRNLEKSIDRELSFFEKQVLDLHLTGMSYNEIAKVLGRDEKSTDNALQRVRTKIRKLIL